MKSTPRTIHSHRPFFFHFVLNYVSVSLSVSVSVGFGFSRFRFRFRLVSVLLSIFVLFPYRPPITLLFSFPFRLPFRFPFLFLFPFSLSFSFAVLVCFFSSHFYLSFFNKKLESHLETKETRKHFFDSFAHSNHFDPAIPDNWKKIDQALLNQVSNDAYMQVKKPYYIT